MEAATIVFTYKRSMHTRKVLDALEKNREGVEKLYIFQDGLKNEEDRAEWEKVSQIIKSVHWCDTEIIIAENNRGLANSVVYGINYVFEKYDAVIVLEDDCVPHQMFMTYMKQGLEKYKDVQRVYSLNGYAWPVEIEGNGTDAYFTGRISSWGWGTWKDRWKSFKRDYLILSRIKKDKELNRSLEIWGRDLQSHLVGNVTGVCDSWAVFWALSVIENNGVCLSPYQSLIDNIGLDGSGTHSRKVDLKQFIRDADDIRSFNLPEKVEFPVDYEKFKNYWQGMFNEEKLEIYNKILTMWVTLWQSGKEIADLLSGNGIKKICVWGRGNVCKLLLKELEGKIEVCAVIESVPKTDYYQNLPVVDIKNIPEETDCIIVLPVYDLEEIKSKVRIYTDCKALGINELLSSALARESFLKYMED